MNVSKPRNADSNQRLTPKTIQNTAGCRKAIERAKRRLDELPNPREDVIFLALTKLKAGLYTGEAAIAAASSKALEAPELGSCKHFVVTIESPSR